MVPKCCFAMVKSKKTLEAHLFDSGSDSCLMKNPTCNTAYVIESYLVVDQAFKQLVDLCQRPVFTNVSFFVVCAVALGMTGIWCVHAAAIVRRPRPAQQKLRRPETRPRGSRAESSTPQESIWSTGFLILVRCSKNAPFVAMPGAPSSFLLLVMASNLLPMASTEHSALATQGLLRIDIPVVKEVSAV